MSSPDALVLDTVGMFDAAFGLPDQMAAFGISGPRGSGLRRLFMTHPPLEERIEALTRLQVS